MVGWLWTIPALPMAGFLLLALVGPRLGRRAVASVGAGSVGLAALVAVLVSAQFMAAPPPGHALTQTLWTWIDSAGFQARIAFYLDPLSIVMTLVVTVVGFLILLYSVEFMAGEEGYSRFFCYMDLFVGSMLTLVLAENLLLLYLGWEGVGLCSYLLIGFWYRDAANGRAGRKAFIVTRIGDAAMALGLFLLFYDLGTLDIQTLMQRASERWPAGSGTAAAAAALLLAGAVGKSAQLPLQTWLPDAMAGPTPVSALIHAATMVTAGVYLIARTHALFQLAPAVQALVAAIGGVTLLLAGCAALVQRDIKRVLAYSTISQIGYMFLALGVGAWSAAMFHFMTHAFFKSLLFLGAGVVILALHHEHDLFRMGGLRRRLPGTFWAFLIGAASLSALPLVTAGFYSKDLILAGAWSSSAPGARWLWTAGMAGALLTSLYTFRMVFLTFFGEAGTEPSRRPGRLMGIPLAILAGLSVMGGFVQTPGTLGHVSLFGRFLRAVLPEAPEPASAAAEALLQVVAAGVALIGIWLAYVFFLRRRRAAERLAHPPAGTALRLGPEHGVRPQRKDIKGSDPMFRRPAARPLGAALGRLWFAGWGFDRLYDVLLVRPFTWLARVNKADVTDAFYNATARVSAVLHRLLSKTQTGRVRWYAACAAFGAIVTIAVVVFG